MTDESHKDKLVQNNTTPAVVEKEKKQKQGAVLKRKRKERREDIARLSQGDTDSIPVMISLPRQSLTQVNILLVIPQTRLR